MIGDSVIGDSVMWCSVMYRRTIGYSRRAQLLLYGAKLSEHGRFDATVVTRWLREHGAHALCVML